MTADAAVAAGLVELASWPFAKPIHEVHNLTCRAIARFLITGQGTTETERNFIGRLGVTGVRSALSVATLTRSYLLWRDTNLRMVNEESTAWASGRRFTTRHGRSSGRAPTRASFAWLRPTTS